MDNTMENVFPKLEDLEVWRNCRELKNEIITVTKSFPDDERFRLKDQVVRASRSITNNIAEGYGRFNYQENIQFLRVSRGSIYECIDHLYCCLDENFISENKFKNLYDQCTKCLKLLNGYIRYLKNRKKELTI